MAVDFAVARLSYFYVERTKSLPGGYHTFHATCKDFGEQVRTLIYMLVAIFVI